MEEEADEKFTCLREQLSSLGVGVPAEGGVRDGVLVGCQSVQLRGPSVRGGRRAEEPMEGRENHVQDAALLLEEEEEEEVPLLEPDATALKNSQTFGCPCQIAASFQAFMPPRLLPHNRDHFGLFVLFDLLLNCSPIMPQSLPLTCIRSTPQAAGPPSLTIPTAPPPHRPPASHLLWATDPAPAPPQRSLHCDTSFPSAACCPPANRDWCGGMDRWETWPSSGARRTRPRPQHPLFLLSESSNLNAPRLLAESSALFPKPSFQILPQIVLRFSRPSP
ncbi:hypothetical protein EYF80_013616 [Liparis tanakae]|uniref:Uncharacterized protein n=1 Tax=Liparis tanakae TaxID=230148 RepID=A0A4Z2IER9_9TELE|nr:hypothetical protein EYF80_013616 [Liparis tanakae]